MTQWLWRVERAQLLLLPVLVGLVGVLQGSATSAPASLPRFEVAMILLAVLAPMGAWLLASLFWRGIDAVMLALIGMLTNLSVTLLYAIAREVSSSSGFYQEVATRQAAFVVLGYACLVVGVVVAQHLDTVVNYPYTMAFAALLLTTTTIFFGAAVNGARLWLELGPIRLQPGEVSRLLLTTFIAIYLYGKRHHLAGTWRVAGLPMPAAPHLVPLAGGVLVAIAVLAWQNDLGMAAAIGLVAACYAAGAMWSRTGASLAIGTVVVAMSLAYAFVPRVQSRTDLWLDAWSAPASGGYQFVQGDFALAGGGIFGAPTMEAAARVPEFHTDFVLVAIGARFGVAVVVATLCLMAFLVLRSATLALRARNELASYVGIGITLMVGIQSILIVGGSLRLLPLTGLTAPLVSYGGTSMVVTLFSLGVVIGIGAEPRSRANVRGKERLAPAYSLARAHASSRKIR